MAKSADAFRTISEVAEWLDLPTHVLRFWESKFSQVKPVKRAGGRRYYRPNDMRLLGGIKKLLHDDGMTIKGAQKVLREQGAKYVSGLSQALDEDESDGVEESTVEGVVEGTIASTTDTPEVLTEKPALTTKAPTDDDVLEETVEKSAVVSFPGRVSDNDISAREAAPQTTAAEDAAPEDTTSLETPEAIAPEVAKSSSSLPSFLMGDTDEPSDAPHTTNLAVSTPDDPSDTSFDANAGILSRLAASKTRFSPEILSALAKAQAELRQLAANR